MKSENGNEEERKGGNRGKQTFHCQAESRDQTKTSEQASPAKSQQRSGNGSTRRDKHYDTSRKQAEWKDMDQESERGILQGIDKI